MTEAADTSAPGPEEIDGENEIVLADRYRILPNSPLPEMGMPGSKAYTARDLKNPNEQVFARICEPNVFSLVEVMVQLKNMREAYTVIPEDWGPIYWPATGERCFAIIFRRPEGGALMPSLTAGIPKIDPEILIKTVLSPALVTLSVFERKKITHRAIRPDNIFKTAVEGAGCLFGDCVSVPPSWGAIDDFRDDRIFDGAAVGPRKGDDLRRYLRFGRVPADTWNREVHGLEHERTRPAERQGGSGVVWRFVERRRGSREVARTHSRHVIGRPDGPVDSLRSDAVGGRYPSPHRAPDPGIQDRSAG